MHLDDMKNRIEMYEKYRLENISKIEEAKNNIDELDSEIKVLKKGSKIVHWGYQRQNIPSCKPKTNSATNFIQSCFRKILIISSFNETELFE
jgi:hypothetical protein